MSETTQCEECGEQLYINCFNGYYVQKAYCENCKIGYVRKNETYNNEKVWCNDCEERHNKIYSIGEFEKAGYRLWEGYEQGNITCICGRGISISSLSFDKDPNFEEKTVECECGRDFSFSVSE